jgi:solute carrier family 35 (UDP-galactose transporter), member B1
LKHEYVSDEEGRKEQFNFPIMFTIFPQLVCAVIGWSIRLFMRKYQGVEPVAIPVKNAALCSLVININMWTYNKAIQAASFPAVVMVKSCSMLSVIIVALFCSRVKEKELKLPLSKLWVGVIVSLGIFLFNFFKDIEGGSSNQPISYLSSALLLISLMGDGLLPDLQAEIKSKFKPGVMDMYCEINKYTCFISISYAAITWQLPALVAFISTHEGLLSDIAIFSVLSAVGQLVIYRMIKLFKQHIVPFVIATRKCVTVVVNIVHFGHSINVKQLAGMVLVFAAILMEVVMNRREKKEEVKGEPVGSMESMNGERVGKEYGELQHEEEERKQLH